MFFTVDKKPSIVLTETKEKIQIVHPFKHIRNAMLFYAISIIKQR